MITLSASHRNLKVLGVLVAVFSLGLLFGVLARDDSTFRSVWVNSYLRMHSSLDPGGNTDQLVVMHDNLSALLDLMEIHPSIVEINTTTFSNVAYVSIKGEERSALQILRDSPSVRFVARNQMVLFCH